MNSNGDRDISFVEQRCKQLISPANQFSFRILHLCMITAFGYVIFIFFFQYFDVHTILYSLFFFVATPVF